MVADAIRYRRRDTAIVRVVVPVQDNDVDGATNLGVHFIPSEFPDVVKQLPL